MAVSVAQSAASVNPKLDLFRVPPTDISTTSYRMVRIHTFTTGINPIEFHVDAQSDFIDFDRSYFEIDLQLKNENGGNLTASAINTAELIAPVNNLAHSLFKQINMRLNGTLISDQSDMYHYKAYLQTLMNFDRQDGETILVPQGWYNTIDVKEAYTATNIRGPDPADGANAHATYTALTPQHKQALQEQRNELDKWTGNQKHVLRMKPFLDVFHMGKVMVPGVQFSIQFYLNEPKLFLDAVARQGRITQDDIKMRFYLCTLRLNDDVFRGLMQRMNVSRSIATYPTLRTEIRSYTFAQNIARKEIDNPFQSRIPNRIIIGLVDSRAFNGNYAYDPFAFQKSGITSVRQFIRGEEYPYETLELNSANNYKDLTGYYRFLQATGCLDRGEGNMVKATDWGQSKNCTLFAIDNVASGCVDCANLTPRQTGELQIELIGEPQPENMVVLVYAEFENLIEIDSNQAVLYDITRR